MSLAPPAALNNASPPAMPTTRGPMTADDSGRIAEAPPVVEDSGGEFGMAVPPASGRTEGQARSIEAAVRALSTRALEVRARADGAGSQSPEAPGVPADAGEDERVAFTVAADEQVDASPVPGNPRATIARAQAIRRDALQAPNPSASGLSVAVQAQLLEQGARAEIAGVAPPVVAARAVAEEASADAAIAESSPVVCPHCGSAHSGAEHVAINQRLIDSAFGSASDATGAISETA